MALVFGILAAPLVVVFQSEDVLSVVTEAKRASWSYARNVLS